MFRIRTTLLSRNPCRTNT